MTFPLVTVVLSLVVASGSRRPPGLYVRSATSMLAKRDPPPAAAVSALQQVVPTLHGAALGKAAAALPSTAWKSAEEMAETFTALESHGLSRADIGAIVAKRPMSIRRFVVDAPELTKLLEGLSLQGIVDAGPLLRAQPKVLYFDEARLREAVRFLEGYVGQGRFAEFVRMHPEALLWCDANALPVAAHLRALGLPKSVIDHVRKAFPKMDALLSADNVAAVLGFLQGELGLSTAALGSVLRKFPPLLALSLENVRTKVEYVGSLGVAPARAIVRHPALLGLSLEMNIRPTASYLESLDVDLSRALEASPSILSLSLQANVMPTVEYLRSLGMVEVGRVITKQPAILSLSVTSNLQPKVAFLTSLGLDELPGGLGAQLDAYPALLTLSLESNLRPTAEALMSAGLIVKRASAGDEPTALRARHLAASLEGRVRPRLAFADLMREVPAAGEMQACAAEKASRLTLGAVTTYSDANFAKQMGATADEFAAFKDAWKNQKRSPLVDTQKSLAGLDWLPDGFDLTAAVLDGMPPDERT